MKERKKSQLETLETHINNQQVRQIALLPTSPLHFQSLPGS